jgi:hypothetical protein
VGATDTITCTVCVREAEVLLLKLVLPLYVAVMVCVPEASVDVVNFATPPLTPMVFRAVVPSWKVTVPVTFPLNCGVTLAVKVTDCAKFDGFSDETKAVVVVALLTTWLITFDVLPGKFESPPYTALTAFVPAGNVEVIKLAEPPVSAPVPSTVVPFTNEMVSPSGGGAPALEVTVAVKVTACP